MNERQKALLWRLPLVTAIVFGTTLYFVPSAYNKILIVSSLALIAFNAVVFYVFFENYDDYQKQFRAGSYRIKVCFVFIIGFILGFFTTLFVILPATRNVFWSLIIVSVSPYVALAIYTVCHFVFAFDKIK